MKFTLRSQRRRSSQTGPGISLFPFLAVLICTMGALVPLLLAITRTARLQGEAAAAAKLAQRAAQRSAELRVRREDVQWRIGQLKRSREQTAAQLADARLELGHLEDHSRRLRSQLAQYKETVGEFERLENTDQQRRSQTQTELEQVRRQIGAAQQEVAEARKTATSRNRSYAIVPYEGPNQTHRRPVYIECRADAVVLQPEGVALTESDFDGPMGPGNPLAAALRAAREYLLARRDFDPQAGEPYPMLLVRPDGIAAFYVARAAMKSWGSDFGYELIGDDWKLAYQPPDPRLADVLGRAIASARVYQEQLIAAAPRQYDHRPKTTYRASNDGGFVREGGGSGDDDQGYASANSSGPVGRNQGSGFGGQGSGGGGQGSGVRGQGPGSGGQGSGFGGQGLGNGGQGAGGGTGSGDGGYNPYVTTAGPGPAGSGSGGTGALPGAPGGGGSAGGATGGNGYGGQPVGGGNGTGGSQVAGSGGSGNAAPSPTCPAPAGQVGNLSHDTPPNGAGQVGNLSQDTPPNGTGQVGNPPRSANATERQDGYIVGQPPREQDTSRGQPPPDAVPAPPLRPGEWEPSPDRPPEKKDDDKNKDDDKLGKRSKPKPLASKRGDDWALREAGRGAVGVTRPMFVECYADRMVVVSDRGPSGNKVVPLGPRTAQSVDLFISAVWDQIGVWGMAGRGMYWRPVLQVRVAPGAEQRFSELSALLEGSGLTVEKR